MPILEEFKKLTNLHIHPLKELVHNAKICKRPSKDKPKKITYPTLILPHPITAIEDEEKDICIILFNMITENYFCVECQKIHKKEKHPVYIILSLTIGDIVFPENNNPQEFKIDKINGSVKAYTLKHGECLMSSKIDTDTLLKDNNIIRTISLFVFNDIE